MKEISKQLKGIALTDAEIAFNKATIGMAVTNFSQKQFNWNSPREVEQAISDYFVRCADVGMRPTMTGLCTSLGMTKEGLKRWKNLDDPTEQQAVAVRAYYILEELWEQYMYSNKINAIAGIFIAKNHFDYKDVHETRYNRESEVDLKGLEDKYRDLPIIDISHKGQ